MSGLFSPKPAAPDVFVEQAEKAFHFEVSPGWKAEGSLKKSKPNGRYIIVDMTGPGGALIFAGHPDLPLRFLAPSPWHTYWPPGQRMSFNVGTPAEEAFWQSPLMNAPQACQQLASRRFGPTTLRSATQNAGKIQETMQALMQAGGRASFCDACGAHLASQDGQKFGYMELVVFGGGNPGETWQIEDVRGFWTPREQYEEAVAAYRTFSATLKAGEHWGGKNPDRMPQAIGDYVAGEFRNADKNDRAAEVSAGKYILGKAQETAGEYKKHHCHVRKRKHSSSARSPRRQKDDNDA